MGCLSQRNRPDYLSSNLSLKKISKVSAQVQPMYMHIIDYIRIRGFVLCAEVLPNYYKEISFIEVSSNGFLMLVLV